MNGHSAIAPQIEDRARTHGQPYLATFRALAACTREIARLCTEVVRGAEALRGDEVTDKPVVRQANGRCIVQLGPVALTLTWLRSTLDSAADGELLVVVWRGTVGTRGRQQPERAAALGPSASATAVWEDVRMADAASEEAWSWRPPVAHVASLSSTQLAARCVAELRRAYLAVPQVEAA